MLIHSGFGAQPQSVSPSGKPKALGAEAASAIGWANGFKGNNPYDIIYIEAPRRAVWAANASIIN